MTILLIIAAVIICLIIVIAVQPNNFRITRSATIAASAETVFAEVNDFHKWNAWSPWAKMDPTAKNSYAGSSEGVGSSFAWDGKKSGAGRMTITDSQPHELVRFRLEFFKPFKATNVAEFTILPEGGQTVVTWSMSGTNNFIAKAVGLFMDCDKMCGGFFEKGLADMKAIAESQVVAK